MLEGFSFDVSHQEIERILSEVEAWYFAALDQAGVEWLPVQGITNFLFNDLGYEDIDEFEDAIQGSFTDFLNAFPHMELRKEGEGETEKWFIKVRRLEPGLPRRLAFTVEKSGQLLTTTFMKAPDADLEIPCLELVIGADSKRHIDSLYQHIVAARDDLENNAQALAETAEQQAKIGEIVRRLGELLDVEEPFEVVVNDPSALSEFSPAEGVRVLEAASEPEKAAAVEPGNSTLP